jgi:hypothetical protein
MTGMCDDAAALAYASEVPGYVVLGLARNRFCENIGRHHKGNRILIIIQLHPHAWPGCNASEASSAPPRADLAAACHQARPAEVHALRGGLWWQKCQDPDCRAAGFRSAKRPVPRHIMLTVPGWEEGEAVRPVREDACQDECDAHGAVGDEDIKRILGESSMDGEEEEEEEEEATYTGLHEHDDAAREEIVFSSQ